MTTTTTLSAGGNMVLRPAHSRGHANFGWLDSHHTFSFGNYYDPEHMGFGVLRVLNEDRVAGGGGFPPHPHRDMEIISYVIDGGLAHQDSTGGEGIIRPDELQVMTAGTGVTHSEFNASETAPVHFLQLWLLPAAKNLTPRYAQQAFARVPDQWQLLATPDADKAEQHEALLLHAKGELWRWIGGPASKPTATPTFADGVWLQVVRGEVTVGEQRLRAGDGVAVRTFLPLLAHGDGTAEVLAIGMV
jgi:redox-sensitive bicupin YhaK (pirin superfamily)